MTDGQTNEQTDNANSRVALQLKTIHLSELLLTVYNLAYAVNPLILQFLDLN